MNAGKCVLPDAVLGWFIYPPDFRVVQARSAFRIPIGCTGRSEDASPKHSWVTSWFQAEVLETANSYWPLTSAGSLHWEPNFHWLMAQAGSRGQPRGMLNSHWPRKPAASPYVDEVGSLREPSAGGIFSEDAGEVRSARRRVGGGMGSATQLR